MKYFIFIISLFMTIYTSAQTTDKPTALEEPRNIPTKTESKVLDTFVFNADELDEKPKFKQSFLRFLEKNITYPKDAVDDQIQGKVVIDFKVDKKGNLSKFKLSETSETNHKALVNEAIRILQLTAKGKWNPGKKYDLVVNCNFSQTIIFALPQ